MDARIAYDLKMVRCECSTVLSIEPSKPELACPVYHVGLIDQVRKILKVVCFNCSRVLIDDPKEKEKIASIQYPK